MYLDTFAAARNNIMQLLLDEDLHTMFVEVGLDEFRPSLLSFEVAPGADPVGGWHP